MKISIKLNILLLYEKTLLKTLPKGEIMLKRLFTFILILSLCIGGISAQNSDYDAAMGIGPEWNMNSRYNFAMGGVYGFDVNLPESIALGFTVTGSNNLNGITVLEPAALFRLYFLGRGSEHKGFFAQTDIGAFLIFEEGDIKPMILGGLRGGYRFIPVSHFYVEPYGRIGYPFAFGIGVMAGITF